MGALTITIFDTGLKQSIGLINIPLKLYLNKNLRPEQGIHTFIELDDRFPIVKVSNPKEKIGEVQIRIEGTASFEKPGIQDDIRLANSMAIQDQQKTYTGTKYKQNVVSSQQDYMKTVQEMKNKLAQTKQRAVSANRTLPRQVMVPPKQRDASEAAPMPRQYENEGQFEKNESDNTQQELEEMLERGRKLQGKMTEALKTEQFGPNEKVWSMLHGDTIEKRIIPTNVHALDFEVNDVSDSLSDVSIYHKPNDLQGGQTTKQLPIADDISENNRTENLPLGSAPRNLKDLRKMNISLVGISFKNDEIKKRLTGQKLYILAKLPVAEYGSVKIHEEEMKAHFSLEKSNTTGIVELNRAHECGISVNDDNFGNLVNSKISVELMAGIDDNTIFQSFGKGEISFQKVVLSTNYKLDTLINIVHIPPGGSEPDKPQKAIDPKAKKVAKKETKKTGKMTVSKNKLTKIQPMSIVASVRLIIELTGAGEQKTMGIQKATLFEGDEMGVKPVTLGLLLCVKIGKARDVPLRKFEGDQTQIFRNLYIKYKSFPNGEPMSTNISWGSSTPIFNHTTQYPLFLTPDLIQRLSTGLLIFEVWDKTQAVNGQDELVGLCKVQLKSFHESLKSQVVSGAYTVHHILMNQYPFIIIDDFVPIINPRLGQAVGSLGLTVAIGTPAQIQRLDQKEKEYTDKMQKMPIFSDQPEPKEKVPEIKPSEEVQVTPTKEIEENPPTNIQPEKQESEQIHKENVPASQPPEKQQNVENIQPVEPEKEQKISEPVKNEEPIKTEEIQIPQKSEEPQKIEEIKPEKEPEKKIESEPLIIGKKTEEKKEEEVQKSADDITEITRLLNPQTNKQEEKPKVEENKHEEIIQQKSEQKTDEIEDIVKLMGNKPVIKEEIKTKSPEKPKFDQPIPQPVFSQISPRQKEIIQPELPKNQMLPQFIKHSFNISISELANIPVISKFIAISQGRAINLYLRASLPFDRTPVESESIMQVDTQNYKVAMESEYSILLPFDKDQTEELLKNLQQDICVEICALDKNTHLPIILGNAELPVEDVRLLLMNKPKEAKETSVERVAFVYGTTASDREGLIIGKLRLKIGYKMLEIEAENIGKTDKENISHMWQQEKVVNREIPVNCRLMIFINRIDGIDESRSRALSKNKGLNLPTPDKLNLSVHYNPIGELIYVDPKDEPLARQENEYSTGPIYCSAEPKYKKRWYIDFAVDQKVLEFMEHEGATIEIKHHIASFSSEETFGQTKGKDESTVLVGIAKIPLIKLLSSHAGIINEAIEIKDLFGTCFGYLHLSMNLLDAVLEIPKPPEATTLSENIQKTIMSPHKAAEIIEPPKRSEFPIGELEISIESGLRLKNPLDGLNPPNSYAAIKHSVLNEQIFTQVIPKSSFPTWNFSKNANFELSPANIEALQNEKLQIFVYHKEALKDKETDLLIGVAEVDTTFMGTIEGMEIIDGYYKIKNPDKTSENQDDGLGIIKVKIVPSTDLIKNTTLTRDEEQKKSMKSPNFNTEHPIDEAKTLQDVYETLRQIRGDQPILVSEENLQNDQIEEKREDIKEPESPILPQPTEYDEKLNQIVQEISAEESEALLKRHLQNLEELDSMNKKLRGEVQEETIEKPQKIESPKKPESVQKVEEPIKNIPEPKPSDEEELNLEGNVQPQKEENTGEYELEIRGDIPENTQVQKPEPLVPSMFEKNMLNAERLAGYEVPLTPEPTVPAVQFPQGESIPLPKVEQTVEKPAEIIIEKQPEQKRNSFAEPVPKQEEEIQQKPATQLIDRKKLLSTPHKKPPLPAHLSSSIKRMSGADLKEKELERITRIMRASPGKEQKKYYEYSSDSDS